MSAHRVSALLRASHPEPAVAVTALTTALSASAGRSGLGVAGVACAVGLGQLSVGWSNDAIDAARDRQSGRADKPVASGELPPGQVFGLGAVALGLAVALSFGSGWRAALAHIGALALAWGYNLRLKSTRLSVLAYAGAFGLLPAFVTLGLRGHPAPPWWAVLAGALLGVGAHFANTLPDLADDVSQGILGLPHRVGDTASRIVSVTALLAATAVLTAGPGRPSWPFLLGAGGAAAVGLAGLALGGRPGSGRVAFRAVIVMAVLDVSLLLVRGARLG